MWLTRLNNSVVWQGAEIYSPGIRRNDALSPRWGRLSVWGTYTWESQVGRGTVVRPLVVNLVPLGIRQQITLGLNFRPYTTWTNRNTGTFKKERINYSLIEILGLENKSTLGELNCRIETTEETELTLRGINRRNKSVWTAETKKTE